MDFLICNQKYLFKAYNWKQRQTKTQTNVWKPSSLAALAKFKEWTQRTKLCAPPWGIYLLTENNLGNSTGGLRRRRQKLQ